MSFSGTIFKGTSVCVCTCLNYLFDIKRHFVPQTPSYEPVFRREECVHI